MKKIKILLSLMLLLCMALPMLTPKALAVEEIETLSPCVILAEVESGTIVYEKNAYTPRFPASITKIMTVLLACEYIEDGIISENELVTVTEDAWYLLESDSSNLGIMPGEEVPFIDLMYCAMLASANEACNAIAVHACKDINTFVAEMNRKAAALGCKDTHFVTTNGLHDDNHYTTAYDMYLITAEALKHPLFVKIFGTAYFAMPATNNSKERYMYHTNRLMNKDHECYYEYCTGGKTGSTSQAGYCLVSTAEKDGVKYICIIMGAERTENEDKTYTLNTYIDSIALYNWAFDNFGYHAILSPKESVASIPIYMGDDADAVELMPAEEIVLFLPNSSDDSDVTVSVSLYNASSGQLRAPVNQGEVLGEITVYYDGKICGTVKGVAAAGVGLKHTEYIKTELTTTLQLDWVKKAIKFFIGIFILYALYIVLYILIKYLRRRHNFIKAQAYAARIRTNTAQAHQAVIEASTPKSSSMTDNKKDQEPLTATSVYYTGKITGQIHGISSLSDSDNESEFSDIQSGTDDVNEESGSSGMDTTTESESVLSRDSDFAADSVGESDDQIQISKDEDADAASSDNSINEKVEGNIIDPSDVDNVSEERM